MNKIKEFFRKLTLSFQLFAVILIIAFIFIPFPVIVLDIFIGLNILFSVLILLNVLHTKKIANFSLFPTILLISTLFTMAINLAITRTILSNGKEYNGLLIRFLSNIIAGSGETARLWISFIFFIMFFLILMSIIIIKNGTRVSEVAARFTLDSMQVKLMAIETEYSTNAITEDQAQLQKQEVQIEADFYNSSDGAMKFISGNTKVSKFILISIIIGGTIIDYFIRDAALLQAVKTYIHLSIGCGIIFLLPSFIISLAASISAKRLILPPSDKTTV